mmetsp:Transcript_41263/g.80919  ORF Transcript_41263/g.80919 Transcript_41263/m.80919 type:complete len:211 (-) Transcript_41263:127-759(-)
MEVSVHQSVRDRLTPSIIGSKRRQTGTRVQKFTNKTPFWQSQKLLNLGRFHSVERNGLPLAPIFFRPLAPSQVRCLRKVFVLPEPRMQLGGGTKNGLSYTILGDVRASSQAGDVFAVVVWLLRIEKETSLCRGAEVLHQHGFGPCFFFGACKVDFGEAHDFRHRLGEVVVEISFPSQTAICRCLIGLTLFQHHSQQLLAVGTKTFHPGEL